MCFIAAITQFKSEAFRQMQELIYGFEWKLAIAGGGAFLADHFCGDWRIIWIWLFFMFADCLSGMWRGVVTKTFDKYELYGWTKKLFWNLGFIFALNLLMKGFAITAGEPNTFMNVIVLWFATCEAASCTDNCVESGIPIPGRIQWLIYKIRRRTTKSVADLVGDGQIDDFCQFETSRPIPRPPDRRKGHRPDNGRRRREFDLDNGGTHDD